MPFISIFITIWKRNFFILWRMAFRGNWRSHRVTFLLKIYFFVLNLILSKSKIIKTHSFHKKINYDFKSHWSSYKTPVMLKSLWHIYSLNNFVLVIFSKKSLILFCIKKVMLVNTNALNSCTKGGGSQKWIVEQKRF